VLSAVRKVLDFEMTIAEWIGTAIMLAVPYLVIGMVWTAINGGHTDALGGPFSLLASVVSWPALLISALCVT
jgi:hypothetical protein